jgi:stress-induced morphogen
MFQIELAADAFEGKPMVAQHRLVTDLIKDEIKQMHGLTLKTMTPKQFDSLSKTPGKQ